MKYYSKDNVLIKAKERFSFLFDEFENIYIDISGGKDSTVIFNLALEIAREKNRLPLKVLFLDQEAEWDATIDHVRSIMHHPDVEPYWFQIPFRMTNSTSQFDTFVNVWGEGEEWLRPKEDISIKVAPWGANRYHAFFGEFLNYYHKGQRAIHICGVRGEESPTRLLGLTNSATYKSITWGKSMNGAEEHYNFYPIYDWGYKDVWKFIHDNGLEYNRIYDYQYQHGISINKMRISNLHHETAIHQLFYMAEIEPDNYNRLCNRIKGIDSAVKNSKTGFFVYELPFMFADWKEYRDYLLDKLIQDNTERERFRNAFEEQAKLYEAYLPEKMYKVHVQTILANDISHTKLKNFDRSKECYQIRKKYHGRDKETD
jgi:predicted phosphoadenosine phosphosulfate sulfurtransferase